MRPRRPWVAVLLSVLTPGLGHFYAGQLPLAAVAFVVVRLVGLLTIVLLLLLASLGAFGIAAPLVLGLSLWVGLLVHAARTARHAPVEYRLRAYNRWWIYAGILLLDAFVGSQVSFGWIKKHMLEAFQLPSSSMDPTLMRGDYLFVTKLGLARPVERDEVVVYQDPSRGVAFIKRVVGLPGDTLAMAAGALHRNGRSVSEPWSRLAEAVPEQPATSDFSGHFPYLLRDTAGYRPTMRDWGPILVPADAMFLLGDSRDNSYDSRFEGPVPLGFIRGKPLVIYFSVDRAQGWSVRWSRIGARPWIVGAEPSTTEP